MLGKDLSPVAEFIDPVRKCARFNLHESGTIGLALKGHQPL